MPENSQESQHDPPTARRIAACLNACAGISTEHLELNPELVKALAREFTRQTLLAPEITEEQIDWLLDHAHQRARLIGTLKQWLDTNIPFHNKIEKEAKR